MFIIKLYIIILHKINVRLLVSFNLGNYLLLSKPFGTNFFTNNSSDTESIKFKPSFFNPYRYYYNVPHTRI